MDIHVRRLGALSILFGVAGLLVSSVLFVLYGGPTGIYEATDDNVMGLLIAASALTHFLLSIPCIIGGYLLRRLQESARGLMIVACALNVVNVPFGSFLGAYGLWVLLTEETDLLFTLNAHNKPAVSKHGIGPATAESLKKQKSARSAESTIVPSPRS